MDAGLGDNLLEIFLAAWPAKLVDGEHHANAQTAARHSGKLGHVFEEIFPRKPGQYAKVIRRCAKSSA
jgi:hypothetical protein